MWRFFAVFSGVALAFFVTRCSKVVDVSSAIFDASPVNLEEQVVPSGGVSYRKIDPLWYWMCGGSCRNGYEEHRDSHGLAFCLRACQQHVPLCPGGVAAKTWRTSFPHEESLSDASGVCTAKGLCYEAKRVSEKNNDHRLQQKVT